jgi:hypothetical protein
MIHLGLAIGDAEIVAAYSDRLWSRPLERWLADDSEDLTAALGELSQQLALRRGRVEVSVALLPSIVQVRRLDFPPLGADEMRRVLTRDAARYFPRCRDLQIASATPIAGRGRSARPIMAATAASATITTIVAAIRAQGWHAEWIGPAYWAWVAARARSEPATLVVHAGAETIECVQMGGASGAPVTHVRRLPATMAGSSPASGPIVVVAESDRPAALAAQHASRAGVTGGPSLLPDTVHAERARRRARQASLIGGLAAAFLLVAALADRSRLDRTRAAIIAERSALRRSVAGVVAARDSVLSLETRAATLVRLETTMPRWSGIVVTLAKRLPADAHIVALRGRTDSLAVEGVADDAASTLAALHDAPGLGAVHADAPIRQELADGHRTIEHFAVAARIGDAPVTR